MTGPTEDELRWIEQWRYAATALEQFREQDLRALTNEQARMILRQIMAGTKPDRSSSTTSGLIEQQRILHSKL